MIRTFIAVELSGEQKKKIAEVQNALKGIDADVKFVEPENLHLTLRFLGEIGEKDLEKIEEGCKLAVERISPITMSLKGIGVFPNLNYIKIIWVGVTNGKEELVLLKEKLDKFISIGKTDSRPFSPHITIGRVKSARNRDNLIAMLEEFSNTGFGEVEVKELKVKKSELTSKGPIYSDLFEISL